MSVLSAELRAKTALQFDTAKIHPDRIDDVDEMANKIIAGKKIYKQIEWLTGVPWWIIGLLHARESSCDFTKHLHNGDSLQRRTWQVPAGRPRTGNPPFTFVQSAEDALELDGLKGIKDITVANVLFVLENFNGGGYRKRGIPSPYVWAGTDQYVKGKYIGDHKFDPDHVDTQIGVGTLILRLYERKEISLRGEPITVQLDAKTTDIPGYILRNNTFVGVRGLSEACGASVATTNLDPLEITVYRGAKQQTFPAHLFSPNGYVDASDLAALLGRVLLYIGKTKTLSVTRPS